MVVMPFGGHPLAESVETMTKSAPTMYIAVALCLPRQSSNERSFNLSTESPVLRNFVEVDFSHYVY